MSALFLFIFRAMIVASVALFVVGISKPEWLSYRQKQPDIVLVVVLALGLFALGMTGSSKVYYAGTVDTDAADSGVRLAEAVYHSDRQTKRCPAGAKSGSSGVSDHEKTPEDIVFTVKTPTNYDPTIAHPLLMVYAAAGKDRDDSEESIYLTQEATAAGFLIAYADHRSMTPEAIGELARIPAQIAQKWCVDDSRIFLSGHSDGGTIAMGIAFVNGTRHIPAAIAPSAAGITGADLKGRTCPKPLPVMVMHSKNDKLFPGFGKQTSAWWASCNGCSGSEDDPETGCTAYTGCNNGVATWYCEGEGPHPVWPGKNKTVIKFLKTVR